MPKIRGIDYQQLEDALNKVGINTDTKEAVLTIVPPADFTASGTTSANASTTIAGTSTLYLTEVGIGDRISLSSAATTFATVTAIASDTSLTVDAILGNGTSQTILVKKALLRVDTTSQTGAITISDRGTLLGATIHTAGTPSAQGFFASTTLSGDTTHSSGFQGIRSAVTRTITTNQTDTVSGITAFTSSSPTFNVPTGQVFSHSQATAGYAGLQIAFNPTIVGGGTLAINNYIGINIAASATATGTYKTGLQILGISGATNNAFIADNLAYTGNFFINSTNTNPSVLAGRLQIGDPTQTNKFNVGDSTFANNSLSTIATMEGGADGSLGSMRLQFRLLPSATATNRYASINAGDGANNRVLLLNDGGGMVCVGSGTAAQFVTGAGGAVTNGLAALTAPATGTNSAQLRAQSTGSNATRISLAVDNTNAYIMTGGSSTNPTLIFSTNDNTTALMQLTNAGNLGVGGTPASSNVVRYVYTANTTSAGVVYENTTATAQRYSSFVSSGKNFVVCQDETAGAARIVVALTTGVTTFTNNVITSGGVKSADDIQFTSSTTDTNRLFWLNGATRYAQIGIATGAGDLVTGSATNDLCIRANSVPIRLSSDNGATTALLIDATNAASFTNTIDAAQALSNGQQSISSRNTSSTSGSNCAFKLQNDANRQVLLQYGASNGIGASQLTGGPSGEVAQLYTVSNKTFVFGTNGTAAMIIDGAIQNIGMGTAPSMQLGTGLHIKGGGSSYAELNLQRGGAGQGSVINFSDATNTQQFRIGTNIAAQGNDLIFCYGSTSLYGFKLTSAGKFLVGDSGSTNTGRHEMWISSTTDEVLYLRNASTSTSSDVRPALSLNKGSTTNTAGTNHFIDFFVNAGATGSGYIGSSGASAVAFFTSSDARVKKNVASLSGALDTVIALNPVTFQWKADDSSAVGFIAQELAAVMPQMVHSTDDGEGEEVPEGTQPWSMADAGMIPYLVAAIKELKTKNDELEARLATLEG